MSARTAAPEQEPGQVTLDLGVTRSERKQRAGNIIGPVDNAKRGGLVRKV